MKEFRKSTPRSAVSFWGPTCATDRARVSVRVRQRHTVHKFHRAPQVGPRPRVLAARAGARPGHPWQGRTPARSLGPGDGARPDVNTLPGAGGTRGTPGQRERTRGPETSFPGCSRSTGGHSAPLS